MIRVEMAEEGGGDGPMPRISLARALSTSPISASRAVRGMTGRGSAEYRRHPGVVLPFPGRRAVRPGPGRAA